MMMMKRSEGSKWQGSLSQAALCRDAAAIGSLMVPFDDRPDHHDDHGDDGDDDDDYDDGSEHINAYDKVGP